jgi:hypothetical protein
LASSFAECAFHILFAWHHLDPMFLDSGLMGFDSREEALSAQLGTVALARVNEEYLVIPLLHKMTHR